MTASSTSAVIVVQRAEAGSVARVHKRRVHHREAPALDSATLPRLAVVTTVARTCKRPAMLGRPLAAVLASLSSIALLLAAPADDAVAARVHVRGAACPGVDMADRVRAQLGPDATLPDALEVDGTLRQR